MAFGLNSMQMVRFIHRGSMTTVALITGATGVRPINSGGFSDRRYPMAITMGWHRIRLSRQEYESGEINLLLGAFRAAYIGRNGPVGMAMFGCWADDGECYFVYTTPSSVRHITPLLDAYSASRIDKPNPIGLSLIYGDESGLSSREVGFEA
jgi:hypothetical protein